jgi:hypothetical protein
MVYCGGFKRYNETCYGELENGLPGYELLASPRPNGGAQSSGA